jgi:excisionase family DNA binding protein
MLLSLSEVTEKCEGCEIRAPSEVLAIYVRQVPADEPLLPSGEIARRLGVTPRTISQWVADGRLVPDVVTAGGRYRFRWSSVERQLRERRERGDG